MNHASSSTDNFEAAFVAPLLNNPVLGQCSYESLARLLAQTTERSIPAGEPLFAAGEAADCLYVVRRGTVRIERDGNRAVVPANGLCGEESAIDLPNYLGRATADTELSVLAIPRKAARAAVAANPPLRTLLYETLAVPETAMAAPGASARRPRKSASADLARIVGWLCAIALPALILWLGPQSGLQHNATLFLAVFAATVSMWVFSLADEYVPGLFAIFAILILGIAPPSAILSGFASDGFFLAMSILGLGTVIVTSGLSYRFLLWLMLRLPAGERWQGLGLLLTGFLLTPMVPSINGRVALLAPLAIDMIEILKGKAKGALATGLAITTFTGASLLSAVFLSSKSVNFVVYGLLPDQAQAQFQWLFWLYAGATAGAAMTLAYFVLMAMMRRDGGASRLNKDQIAAQLKLLGPLRNRELSAILGMGVFMLAVLTAAVHKIQPPWVAVAILYALLVYGFLDKKEFREKIDWPFLIYLAGIVGLVGTFNAVGLDDMLAARLSTLGNFMRTDFALFVPVLAAVIFVIRLVVPISTTIVVTSAVFVPLAVSSGINPWVVGFTILILGEMWFFPYQCSYYLQFRELMAKSGNYDESAFLRFNFIMNIAKVGAIYASFPYWKWLGLL